LEAGHRFCEDFDQAVFASARKELPVGQLQRELKGAEGRYQAQDVAAFLSQIAQQGGLTFYQISKWDEALASLQAGLSLAVAYNNCYDQGVYLGNIGLVYQDKGEWDKALEFYEKSLKIYEQVDDIYGMALTLRNIGFLRIAQRDFEEAVKPLEQAIYIFNQVGDERNVEKHQMALNLCQAGGRVGITKYLKKFLQLLIGR